MEDGQRARRVRPDPEQEQTTIAAKFFRALGDTTRLRILERLLEQERNVKDLVELLGMSQSRISNHLSCLKWCGFVAAERRGNCVFYRITDERVKEIVALGRQMIADNADHIRACTRIES